MDKLKFSRRRVIQLLSALIYNANLKGFGQGKIYKGAIKGICVPGLNCYSCPGAIASCPLGSLQLSLTNIGSKLPLYIIGTLLVFGSLFGRAICAFLCPFGLIQEFLHKIPSPKINKNKWTYHMAWLKYAILFVFVILLPVYTFIQNDVAVPAFCKYICPAGTLEGGIPLIMKNSSLRNIVGTLFHWKVLVLLLIIMGSVFMYRFFCRFLCPLGAIYSFFNRHALFGICVDEKKCTNCGNCTKRCKMDTRYINDRECIRCGDCQKACHYDAIVHCPGIKRKIGEEKCGKIGESYR